MFSGIIETSVSLLDQKKSVEVSTIWIERPSDFDDIKIGDSIALNGVCLTVEEFDSSKIRFALGEETLKITKWDQNIPNLFNIERSLKFNDRIHGHLVSGHVDAIAQVVQSNLNSETLDLKIRIPKEHLKYVWKKGSLCLNGVSLTINDIQDDVLSFYLIPETLKKTNFKNIKVGDYINIEVDMIAKVILRQKELE